MGVVSLHNAPVSYMVELGKAERCMGVMGSETEGYDMCMYLTWGGASTAAPLVLVFDPCLDIGHTYRFRVVRRPCAPYSGSQRFSMT
jgi:hypothetical protein